MSEAKMRALSIRQPYAELIFTARRSKRKTTEYRSRRTHIRERVYIYACKAAEPLEEFEKHGIDPDDFPLGVLVGTVEIDDCIEGDGEFEWKLKNPIRLETPLGVTGVPQPGFFWPFGKQ